MSIPLAKRSASIASVWLHRLLGCRSPTQFGILLYHRIVPTVAGLPAPTWNVEPRRFREQLVGLLEQGFTAWPLTRALAAYAGREATPERVFIVTFDDAYASVFQHAWPVLRELDVPATVFLSTAYLDQSGPFPFDDWGTTHRDTAPPDAYRPLSRDECRRMCDRGLIGLGSHAHTHQDLRGKPDELRRELQRSLPIVRELSGQADVAFAFPYGRRHSGHASDELIEAARSCGVSAALTTEAETVDVCTEPWGWGRFNVYDWDTGATLAARLAGWYGWAPRLQARLSGKKVHDTRPSDQESLLTCR
jgi:peptidoglycan/xylan/chitin deacetylase (PgdA/CDA1 family)